MKKLSYLAVILVVIAPSAKAVDLPIRSGEHESFSRLVLDLPIETNWSLDQKGREVRLLVDLPEVSYLTEDVFTRMPKTRVTEIFQDSAGAPLFISLGCDCSVNGSLIDESRLVLDISDPTSVQLFQTAEPKNIKPYLFSGARNSTSSTNLVTGLSTTFSTAQGIVEPDREPNDQSQIIDKSLAAELFRYPNLLTGPLAEGNALKESQNRLTEQVGRAIGQGLLTLQIEPEAYVRESSAKLEISDRVIQNPGHLTPNPGIAVTSTLTISSDESLSVSDMLTEQCACSDANDLEMQSWGDDYTFSKSISRSRSALFGEFDQVNRESIIELAKAYLYFGFGAEAINVLALSDSKTKEHANLVQIARLLDNEPIDVPNVFFGQHVCDDDSALWAVLSDDVLPDSANDAAIFQSLSRLPAHLRILVIPRLAEKYTAAGKTGEANTIIKVGERVLRADDPAFSIAQAEIDLASNRIQAADDRLTKVSESGSELSVRALISLVDLKWAATEALGDDLAELVASYALEHKHSPLGPKLRRTNVLAFALNGKFDSALDELANVEKRDGAASSAELYALLMALAAQTADDISFLEIALNSSDEAITDLQQKSAEKVAERIFAIGLSDHALSFADRYEAVNDSKAFFSLRAEILLDLGRPDQALLALAQVPQSGATHLRARALHLKGDHGTAARMFSQEGDEDSELLPDHWTGSGIN